MLSFNVAQYKWITEIFERATEKYHNIKKKENVSSSLGLI